MHSRAAFPVANLLSDLPLAFMNIPPHHLSHFPLFERFLPYFRSLLPELRHSLPYVYHFRPHIIQYPEHLIPEFLMRRVAVLDLLRQLLSYSLAGIMESEFSRISLVCEGSFVVPRNGLGMAKCHNVGQPNQACTLRCAQPELGTVKAGYFLDLWRYIFVVLG